MKLVSHSDTTYGAQSEEHTIGQREKHVRSIRRAGSNCQTPSLTWRMHDREPDPERHPGESSGTKGRCYHLPPEPEVTLGDAAKRLTYKLTPGSDT